jgi:hypothetical protein
MSSRLGLIPARLFLEGSERFAEDAFAQLFLFRGRQVGVSKWVDDAVALDDPVRAHHLRHGYHRGDLRYRDAGFFQLSRDRSAAASGGPSSGDEEDGIDPLLLQPFGDFAPQTPAVLKRVGEA